jgi:CubicO group peptidase (beta-lactamase class C family)
MKKLLHVFCFIAILTTAKAQIDSALAAQLQGVLDYQVTNAGNHGVSAHLILQNGETWTGTSGVDGQSMPMTDSTVFIAASISKLNIATLLLLFAEDGIIHLDSSWYTYVPNLNVAFDTTITIRQLLSHTSGIADYLEVPANQTYVTSDFSHFYTPQYILENIVPAVPDFAPGTSFNYSNSNYAMSAYIAEAVTPNSLKDELRTRLWNPVGMQHTYFGAYEPINDRRAGVWWNFGTGLNNYSSQSDTSMLSFGYGTDNVVTCPTDIAKLVHALINGQILSPQSLNEMETFVPQSFINQWAAGYGLGLHHLLGQQVDTVLGHNGKFLNNSDVFHSQMCGFTLATMSNTETLWEGIYNPMYNVLRNYFQCNAVPVANFYATSRITCPGTAISLVDSSTNMRPTAWNWSCPGGTFVNGTTATDSIPQVAYSSPGVYAISYTASTTAGSDTITKNSYITVNSNSVAYNSNFLESFESVALPNPDWSLSNSGGTDWAVTPMGAATGSLSAYIDNFTNTAGANSSLISPVFDLTGFSSPKLSFKVAYQQKTSGNNDKLQVLSSINCGATWAVRFTKSGTNLATVTPPGSTPLAPVSSQFTTYTVNINALASSNNVRFRFEFFADPAGPGNNIFIDDINIYDAATGLENSDVPLELEVYPNPSQGNTTLAFSLSKKQNISVIVMDLAGRTVETIPSQNYAAGPSKIILAEKVKYAPGIYFVQLNADGKNRTKKIIIQ